MKNQFSITDITKILGVKFETLRTWVKMSFVKPTHASEGQGRAAVFLRDDIYSIALFKNLIDSGFKRDIAAAFLRGFKTSMETVIKSKYIIFKFPGLEGHIGPIAEYIQYVKGDDTENLEFDMMIDFLKNDLEELEHVHIVNFQKIKERINFKINKLF